MKQHITPKQLNELSGKGKKRLRGWWKPKLGDKYVLGESHYWKDRQIIRVFRRQTRNDAFLAEYTPLLSIGQMIEFLDEKKTWMWEFTRWREDWVVKFNDSQHEEKELCDTLWEAVKEALEK